MTAMSKEWRLQECCWGGKVSYPSPCPWGHVPWQVSWLIGLANTHGLATLSADEDVPAEMLEVTAGWFGTAVMECQGV